MTKTDAFKNVAKIVAYFGPTHIDDVLIPCFKIATLCADPEPNEELAKAMASEGAVTALIVDTMGKYLRDPKITQIVVKIFTNIARSCKSLIVQKLIISHHNQVIEKHVTTAPEVIRNSAKHYDNSFTCSYRR
jgi:hypothetical protein